MTCLQAKKALYGFKQAGHPWQKKTLIAVMMNDLDLNHSAVNHLVYFRHSGDEHTIIVVATDNMAVTLK